MSPNGLLVSVGVPASLRNTYPGATVLFTFFRAAKTSVPDVARKMAAMVRNGALIPRFARLWARKADRSCANQQADNRKTAHKCLHVDVFL